MKSLEWICNTFSYQSGTCLAFTLHQLNDLVFRMIAVDLQSKVWKNIRVCVSYIVMIHDIITKSDKWVYVMFITHDK